MRNGNLIATVRVNTTAFKATGSFNNPEMFTQAAPIQADTDLLSPENKESVQVIDRATGVAIVPAINQADDLCAPIPVSTRMYLRIHRILHLVQIGNLVVARATACYLRVKRANNDWNA